MIDVVIYDKPLDEKTLGNGNNGISYEYKHQRSIIYSGKVQAVNGYYLFSFIVPKDINYSIQLGKISLYGHNDVEDAAGYKTDIYVGGAAENPQEDNEGPKIKMYLNSRSFINGSTTTSTPFLIADVSDDHGINISSTGIGRNLVLTIDKGTNREREIVLNDFYTSTTGTYKSGTIEYQLAQLAPGAHTLHLKVWDTYNNSSEASLNFVVGDATEEFNVYTIRSVPNPFKSHPRLLIDHNRPGANLTIKTMLMDMRGRTIFNNTSEVLDASSHVELDLNQGNNWISALKPGVYILRCTISTSNGETKTHTERLIYTP